MITINTIMVITINHLPSSDSEDEEVCDMTLSFTSDGPPETLHVGFLNCNIRRDEVLEAVKVMTLNHDTVRNHRNQ